MAKKSEAELVSNWRARFDYEILETFEAGIALKGAEVKSLRDHGGHLQEAYVRVIGQELWLIGAHIAPYQHASFDQPEERRDRKLLMHKREIVRLKALVQEKGLTLVPLALYLKGGRVKVSVGVGRGKKRHDKREAIKSREEARRIQQAAKRGEY
ncbi:MAG: SsrA-binding protein SmpB [Parachlamydiales bacterium]